MKYTYIFFAPPHTERSAGIRFLFDFMSDLRSLGYEVYWTNSISFLPLESDSQSKEFWISFHKALYITQFGKIVAVYPEVISGNPLGAHRVVRILGNFPGLLGGEEMYRATDMVFLYSNYIRARYKGRVDGIIFKPMLDTGLFRKTNFGKRATKLFYVGKGIFRPGFTTKNHIEITRNFPERSELPRFFNESSEIVIFDNTTSLAQEAALCGCIPILIEDNEVPRDAFKLYELGTAGVAIGYNDVPRAKDTLPSLPELVEQYTKDYPVRVQTFAAKTQKSWPVHSSCVADAVYLLLQSTTFELESLRVFRHDVYRELKNGLLSQSSGVFKGELNESRKKRVLVWGVGKGAISSYAFTKNYFEIIGYTSTFEPNWQWLNKNNLRFIQIDMLHEILSKIDFILIASQYRTEILKTIRTNEILNGVDVLFIPRYLLV